MNFENAIQYCFGEMMIRKEKLHEERISNFLSNNYRENLMVKHAFTDT